MTPEPVHLVAVAGDRRTMCGAGDRRGPATPYRHVDAPPRLPGLEAVCPACAASVPR